LNKHSSKQILLCQLGCGGTSLAFIEVVDSIYKQPDNNNITIGINLLSIISGEMAKKRSDYIAVSN